MREFPSLACATEYDPAGMFKVCKNHPSSFFPYSWGSKSMKMAAVGTLTMHPDLILAVFEHTQDASTLNQMSEAYPTLLRPYLEERFDTVTLGSSWTEELCLLYTILLAERETPTNVDDLKTLMVNQLEGLGPKSIPSTLPRTLQTLRKIVFLISTVDFSVHFCAIIYLMHFPLEKQTRLSSGEDLRIRRALLRFQLYAQLFHQPGDTDEIVSDRY